MTARLANVRTASATDFSADTTPGGYPGSPSRGDGGRQARHRPDYTKGSKPWTTAGTISHCRCRGNFRRWLPALIALLLAAWIIFAVLISANPDAASTGLAGG